MAVVDYDEADYDYSKVAMRTGNFIGVLLAICLVSFGLGYSLRMYHGAEALKVLKKDVASQDMVYVNCDHLYELLSSEDIND